MLVKRSRHHCHVIVVVVFIVLIILVVSRIVMHLVLVTCVSSFVVVIIIIIIFVVISILIIVIIITKLIDMFEMFHRCNWELWFNTDYLESRIAKHIRWFVFWKFNHFLKMKENWMLQIKICILARLKSWTTTGLKYCIINIRIMRSRLSDVAINLVAERIHISLESGVALPWCCG